MDNIIKEYILNIPLNQIKDYKDLYEYGREMTKQIYLQNDNQCIIMNTINSFAVNWFYFVPNTTFMTGYWGNDIVARFAPDSVDTQFSKGNHSHNYIELGYIYKGDFIEVIKEQPHYFHEGDVFLIDSNCIHHDQYTDNESIVFFFQMKQDFFDEVFMHSLENDNLKKFIRNTIISKKNKEKYLLFHSDYFIEDTNKYLCMILLEMQEKKSGYTYIVKGIMNRLLSLFSESYMMELQKTNRQFKNEIRAKNIMDYIERNYVSVTLESLSEKFFYEKNFFNKVVKKETGYSFTEYLQILKLNYAEQLLKESYLSIEDIIHIVGYNNTGYFYKIFKNKYGISPKKYRDKYIQDIV